MVSDFRSLIRIEFNRNTSVSIPQQSQTLALQCVIHREVRLCGVCLTMESDSALDFSLRSQTLRKIHHHVGSDSAEGTLPWGQTLRTVPYRGARLCGRYLTVESDSVVDLSLGF